MDGRFPDASLPLADDALARMAEEVGRRRPEDTRQASLVRRAKRLVPGGTILPARVLATEVVRPLARRRVAAALAADAPVRLHIGSGFEYKPGWTNVDLLPVKVDVPWNLARGIPFPDGSVDVVFHEHLQEHLTLEQGFALAKESLRVLRPGGILRVGVPDAGQVVQSYAGNWDDDWASSSATGMIAIQRLFYDHGHRAMYDGQTLRLLLETAGFGPVTRRGFGEGAVQPNHDTPYRRGGTLYVEAVRPA